MQITQQPGSQQDPQPSRAPVQGTQPEQDTQPTTPRVPVQAPIREPQVTIEFARYDARRQVPENPDPNSDPIGFVHSLIRTSKQEALAQAGRNVPPERAAEIAERYERFSEFYVVCRDKNDPTKIVAVFPIEHATRAGTDGIPALSTGLEQLRIDGITLLDVDANGARAPRPTREMRPIRIPADDPTRQRIFGGAEAEGGSEWAVSMQLDFHNKRGGFNEIPSGRAIMTFDRNGMPCRFTVTRYTRQGVDGSENRFFLDGNPANRRFNAGGTEPSARISSLRMQVDRENAPAAEATVQQWAPTATIDYASKREDGAKTHYPVSFSLQDAEGRATTTVSGTLTIEGSTWTVTPADNNLLVRAFDQMHRSVDGEGRPRLHRITTPSFGDLEPHAEVTINGSTKLNVSVIPVSFRPEGLGTTFHAFAYIDADKKLHLLRGDQVTLQRPQITDVAQKQNEGAAVPNTFTANLRHADYDAARGAYVPRSIPVVITTSENGMQMVYAGTEGTPEERGRDIAIVGDYARRGVLRAQIPEGGGLPTFIPVQPDAKTAATAESVAQVQSAYDHLQMGVVEDQRTGVLRIEPSKPLNGSEMVLRLGAGAEQEVSVAIGRFLPPGIQLSSEVAFARQSTDLNGVPVLPFVFRTAEAIGQPPSFQHQGFLRLAPDGTTLETVGQGDQLNFKIKMKITGVRVLPELNPANAGLHSDNGFMPLQQR